MSFAFDIKGQIEAITRAVDTAQKKSQVVPLATVYAASYLRIFGSTPYKYSRSLTGGSCSQVIMLLANPPS